MKTKRNAQHVFSPNHNKPQAEQERDWFSYYYPTAAAVKVTKKKAHGNATASKLTTSGD